MKAIVLLSGGLDSTVMLAMALQQKRECFVISFDYGQRHKVELEAAKKIVAYYGARHRIMTINAGTFAQSSLVSGKNVPKNRTLEEIGQGGIPNTYVPARNTLFLAYALGQAELSGADEIYFGANALDVGPYPDCHPAFFQAFQGVYNIATRQAVMSRPPQLVTPLINWDKATIIRKGIELKAPLHLTFSCYDPTAKGEPCKQCDACVLREKGFAKAMLLTQESIKEHS